MEELKLIGQGRTADIYEFQDDTIIKLYKQSFPHDAIVQEFEVSKFVYSLGINTPLPVKITQADSRTGIVYERIHGTSLLKLITTMPWLIDKHSKTLAKLHYDIHSHPDVSGELRDQKGCLIENINKAPLLDKDEKEKIIAYLQELPTKSKLCHGDFHPDNVLVGEQTIIIDWMTGMSGNPAGDVARTALLLSIGTMPEESPQMVKNMVTKLRNRIKSVYLKHYMRWSGLALSDIESWILPVAAARLTEWLPDEEKEKLIKIIRERLSEGR